MLLCVVADYCAVTTLDYTGVRVIDTGENSQQRGLAGTVQTQDHDPRSAIHSEIDVREHLQAPVRARQARGGQRDFAAGTWFRESKFGNLVANPFTFGSSQQAI